MSSPRSRIGNVGFTITDFMVYTVSCSGPCVVVAPSADQYFRIEVGLVSFLFTVWRFCCVPG